MRFCALRLHRWLGISVGVVFTFIAMSGSVLVFAPEIENQLYPILARSLPANWRAHRPQVFAAFERAHAPGQILLIRFPTARHSAYQLYLRDGSQEFRNPVTGKLLIARKPLGDLVMLARSLHTELLTGKIGEQVLGWLGLIALVLLVTGIWLWLPRRGRWRDAFQRPHPLPSRPTAHLRQQLVWCHKTLGIITVAPLLLVTLTGAALIFYAPAQTLLTAAFGGQPPELPIRVSPPRATRIDWPAVFTTLDRTLPQGRTVFFYPPQQNDAPLLFRKHMPGELHPNGRSFIALTRTGLLLFASDASRGAGGLRAANAIYPLHSGRLDLPRYRALITLLGVMPLLFLATGLCMWRLRSRATRKKTL